MSEGGRSTAYPLQLWRYWFIDSISFPLAKGSSKYLSTCMFELGWKNRYGWLIGLPIKNASGYQDENFPVCT